MSTGIEQLKSASQKVQEIVEHFLGMSEGTPDAVAERTAELEAMNKADLIALVVSLEKTKTERAFTTADVVKTILEEPACAILTYEQIAERVRAVMGPESKTSVKTVASYASKNKDDWNVVPRQKLTLTTEEVLGLAGNA